MRVLVLASGSAQAPETKTVLRGCPLNFVIRQGRWLAEVPPGGECSAFLEEAKKLPPETRKNIGRHLVGFDVDTLPQIQALLH